MRIELWDTEVDSIRTFDLESQRSIEQLDEIDIYPATEIVLTKKEAKEGVERIRSEAKTFAEKLRSQQNTEEAYRITGIVKELTEGIEEGWKQTGLDAWISYFNKETVSFLDYFDPEQSMVFLDEPLRLKEQGEAVERNSGRAWSIVWRRVTCFRGRRDFCIRCGRFWPRHSERTRCTSPVWSRSFRA